MTNTFAETAIKQLGGLGKLKAMVRARNFSTPNENTVSFLFSGNRKVNQVVIEIESDDTYSMTFNKFKAGGWSVAKGSTPTKIDELEKFEGVYNSELIRNFEEVTGLYLTI